MNTNATLQKPSQKSQGYYNSKGRLKLECDVQKAQLSMIFKCPQTYRPYSVQLMSSALNGDKFLDVFVC